MLALMTCGRVPKNRRHPSDLGLGQFREHRKAKDVVGSCLGHRKRTAPKAERRVRVLEVQRQRIVEPSPDSESAQVRLQGVTPVGADNEQVVRVACVRRFHKRNDFGNAGQGVPVQSCRIAALIIPPRQMPQFNTQEGRLERI